MQSFLESISLDLDKNILFQAKKNEQQKCGVLLIFIVKKIGFFS